MRRAKITIGLCVLSLLSLGIGRAASPAKGHYDLALGLAVDSPVIAQNGGLVCSTANGCAGTGMDVGYVFGAALAQGLRPASLSLKDSGGRDVSFKVGQDSNADGAYGSDGDAKVLVVCGATADLSKSAIAFRPALDVWVFVITSSLPGCPAPATSGDVTLTYSP